MATEGKKIEVRYDDVSTYELNEDGEFVCLHERAEVEPPCCSGRDCGCYGLYSVYCPDCDYMNMPERDVEALIEASIPDEPEYEPEEDLAYV